MNVDVERHLDEVFSQAAKESEKYFAGKVYRYKTQKDAFSSFGESSICRIVSVRYDPKADTDMYTVHDLNTDEKFEIDKFLINLKLIE